MAPEVVLAVLPAASVTLTDAPWSAVPIATVPLMEFAAAVVGLVGEPDEPGELDPDELVVVPLCPPPPHAARIAAVKALIASLAMHLLGLLFISSIFLFV